MAFGRYGKTSTMRYNKRGSGSRNGSYKGMSSGYKRRRAAPARSRTLAAEVKKINIRATPEKHSSKCFVECPLYHNCWNKGDFKGSAGRAAVTAVTGVTGVGTISDDNYVAPVDAVAASVGFPAIAAETGKNEQMFEKFIVGGMSEHQRSGNEVYVSRMSIRMLLASKASSLCNTFRVVVYMTPQSAPGSNGPPLQYFDGSAAQYNNLLRTIDSRGANILFERIYTPPTTPMSSSKENVGGTSFMNQINIKIGRTITFMDSQHAYGKNGAWGNLHVAVLAYDHSTLDNAIENATTNTFTADDMAYGDDTMGLNAAARAGRVIKSLTPIGSFGMEACIYFKDM